MLEHLTEIRKQSNLEGEEETEAEANERTTEVSKLSEVLVLIETGIKMFENTN
jgi:hypothetical protein